MKIRTKLRIAATAIVVFQATGGLAFAINLAAPQDQTAPAACMPPLELPTGHDNLVDINSAPRDWLVWVGINESLAAKIVGSRPYKARNDLLIRRILPRETYDKIKDRIIARQV